MELDQRTIDVLLQLAKDREANREDLPPITPLAWLLSIVADQQ